MPYLEYHQCKAEIEPSALARQCLSRRIGTQEQLEKEVEVWVKARNAAKVKIIWQFGIEDARDKFKNKYPLKQMRQKQQKFANKLLRRCT